MDTTINILKRLDLLSSGINVNYKGNSRLKTAFGGVLTSSLVVICVLITIYFSREIFERNKPITRESTEYVDETVVKIKDFPIIFNSLGRGAVNMFAEFPEAFELEAINKYFEKDGEDETKLIRKRLTLQKCTEDLFPPEIWAQVLRSKVNLVGAVCINPGFEVNEETGLKEEKDVYFRNPYGSEDSNYIEFIVKACDQEKSPGCRTRLQEYYKRVKLSLLFIYAYIPDTYRDLSDPDNPIKFNMREIIMQTPPDMYTRLYINVLNADLLTDRGVIFEQNSTISFSYFDYNFNYAALFNETDRFYANFTFTTDNLKRNVARRYLKLPELLANLGGFLKSLTLFCSVLSSNYSEYSLYCDVMSECTKLQEKIEPQILIRRREGGNQQETSRVSNREMINLEVPSTVSFTAYLISKFSTSHRKKHKIDQPKFERFFDILELNKHLNKTKT